MVYQILQRLDGSNRKVIFVRKGCFCLDNSGTFTCLLSKMENKPTIFSNDCQNNAPDMYKCPRSSVSECQIGTCFDSIYGTCETGSSKGLALHKIKHVCDPNGKYTQCQKVAVFLGIKWFTSQKTCEYETSSLGLTFNFKQYGWAKLYLQSNHRKKQLV